MSQNNDLVSAADVGTHCLGFLSTVLGRPAEKIEVDADFDRIGLDSAMAVAMIFDLEQWLGIELSPSLLFEYPSISALAGHIAGRAPSAGKVLLQQAIA